MNLSVEHISKKYRKKIVLKDVSLTASSGECIGILGPNGCGKSTLLSILAGVIEADSGIFTVDEHSLLNDRKINGTLISYIPQGTPLIPELTAYDNLKLWYCDSPLSLENELKNGVLSMLGISDFLKTPVNKLSGGMKKRLSIGCAISNNPQILIMDEPGAALDLPCKEQIHQYMQQFMQKGGIILLATHEEQEISLCTKHYLLKDGILTPYNYAGDIQHLVSQIQKTPR